MKKQLLVTALITGLLLGLGATAAQASVDHELEIVIPAVLMIRFVDADGDAVTDADAIVFEPTAANVAAGAANLTPVSTALNWADIEVFANTRPTGFEVTGATSNGDFAWNKVSVTPAVGDLTVDQFNLPVGGEDQIFASATDVGTGGAWQSLGIGPAAYSLTLDGLEEEGTYSTTVTYTIADL